MFDLFYHPFSSYSQKVLIALYENGIAFHPRLLSSEDPATAAEWQKHWPLGRFPVLREGTRTIVEATAIIEHLEVRNRGTNRFIPDDPDEAVEVRMWDRIFDNYVMTPMQAIVLDQRRPKDERDPYGVSEARAMLDKSYAWLDQQMSDREWAVGQTFTLADCAAAPSLFYADWAHPIGQSFANVHAYRRRLNSRPSFARCIEEGRSYRSLFPLGAPNRD